MNVLDAAYNVVHDYPGGAKALGARMGKAALSDEVNPNIRTAKFGLADAVKAQLLARDYRILYAMSAELGHMSIPLPSPDGLDAPCAATIAKLAQKFAELMQSVATDLADNRVDDNELRELERNSGQLVAQVQQLLKHAVTLNACSKPSFVKAAA